MHTVRARFAYVSCMLCQKAPEEYYDGQGGDSVLLMKFYIPLDYF